MSPDHLFLPRGYNENLAEPVDVDDGTGYWANPQELATRRARRYQERVYRFAHQIAPRHGTVLDVGCGIGQNLARRVATNGRRAVGVDQPSAIAVAEAEHPECQWIAGDLRTTGLWEQLRELSPDLVICADVVEHVDDPVLLLERLRWLLDGDAPLVLSTPDRDRLEDQPALGPPRNPHHIREWAEPEMRRLVEAVGFTVRSTRHVFPRHYPKTWLETKMFAWRALHGRAVPGHRSCMVFELTAA